MFDPKGQGIRVERQNNPQQQEDFCFQSPDKVTDWILRGYCCDQEFFDFWPLLAVLRVLLTLCSVITLGGTRRTTLNIRNQTRSASYSRVQPRKRPARCSRSLLLGPGALTWLPVSFDSLFSFSLWCGTAVKELVEPDLRLTCLITVCHLFFFFCFVGCT